MTNKAQITSVNVYPDSIVNTINPHIYGQFLEHLYHSVSNGVWGEMVWNRSFEEQLNEGKWYVDNGTLTAEAAAGKTAWQIYGADNWRNYNIETDARILSDKGSIVLYASGGDILQRNKFKIVLSPKGSNSYIEMTHKFRWQDGSKVIDTVSTKPGTIPLLTWVSVKVEALEQSLKVWVNNALVFDYSSSTMPRQGTPGIGAENGKVQFRDFTVKKIDGTALVNELLTPARHWYFKGNAKLEFTNDALNEKNALRFTPKSGTNILGQHNYVIKKNDPVKGSVWIKGNSGELTVRFTKNEKVLAQTTITPAASTWKEYAFELVSSVDEDDADFQIVTSGKTPFSLDQVSLMAKSSINKGGYRADLLEATKALKPGFIRWPGGSFVEHYDFVNGIGPQHKRIGKLRWDDYDPLSFGIDEYMRYCEATKAEPLMVLPAGYHNHKPYDTSKASRDYWFNKAMDFMEYCLGDASTKWGAVRAKNGHSRPYDIKYWELDNETWKMNPDDYVEIIQRYAPAMRKKYPGITIIACGSGAMSKQALPLDTAVITKAAEYVDMISIHYYEELNKFQTGIKDLRNFIGGLTTMIKASANPQMKIFWSEWNLTGTDMRTGLYAGAILNEFEKDSMVQMACPALWLRHTSATGWDNAFINFDHKGWFAAPNYVVMKLWRDHYAPNRLVTTYDNEQVNIVATSTEDNKTIYIKLVNASDKEQSLQINIEGNISSGNVNMELVAADRLNLANTMSNKGAVKSVSKQLQINQNKIQVALPKYSASVITVNKN
ncbi:MAG: DUF1080 domain-containing protein [Chitinophagaceae bacterium]|nr:DUF1080 domain-containing protein [Chitinophagaceae bacterium]